jgi:hypothetical protein
MAGMPRFSLKDILRGITLASIGFGMLAIAFRGDVQPAPGALPWWQVSLAAFGGMLVGYGLAFPFKYPPHQMIVAMLGMLAAMAWQSGNIFGFLAYAVMMAFITGGRMIQSRAAKRNTNRDSAH